MSTLCLQLVRFSKAQELQDRSASNMASTYVPIDSWVYAVFDRLAAKGYMQSAIFSLRPWTRLECARLIDEANDQILDTQADPDVLSMLRALQKEFAQELLRRAGARNLELRLESIDQRVTAITGTPIRDGFHFAETLVNDEGRPFAQGANLYTGIALRSTAGPFAAYANVELQRVPFAAQPDAAVQSAISIADFTPLGQEGPPSDFVRARALEAYVSFTVANNQFTFGRQSLWWGPARSGTTLFTDNAEPIAMLRYDRVQPFELPGILHVLGPIRVQLLVGRLSGAQYVHANHTTFGAPGVVLSDQPFIHGEKLSFKLTPNLEFGVSRTVLFAGQGAPFTTHTLLRSIFSASVANENQDPGDRRNAVDAEYRIPGLRNCLTGYFDGFSEDQPFPLAYPTESAWISGFVYRCVPRLPRLSIRAEGLLSPHRNLAFPGFFYFNDHYLSGYTNSRQLIGSWIGREGDGQQLWATWQLSPQSNVEISTRNLSVNREFLQGGTLRDLKISADLVPRPDWQLHVEEQIESWHFPLLSAKSQRNSAFTVQLSYRPTGRTQ
ncbi:capsule assembly Wzi family protein [Granulicella sp. 5B5]|nr:capsule assembly Wzi family protein [Granulicella sp. 5B5]